MLNSRKTRNRVNSMLSNLGGCCIGLGTFVDVSYI